MSDEKRKRRIRFMNEFGPLALRQAVCRAYDRHGHNWLTDEQLSEIVSEQVSNWKFTQRLNRRNRQCLQAACEK